MLVQSCRNGREFLNGSTLLDTDLIMGLGMEGISVMILKIDV